jgi:hypothetical protein
LQWQRKSKNDVILGNCLANHRLDHYGDYYNDRIGRFSRIGGGFGGLLGGIYQWKAKRAARIKIHRQGIAYIRQ